jgi:hydrogenase-4 component F
LTGALSLLLIAVPFASALALALIASWRVGVWVNAGSARLQFVVACMLAWHTGADRPRLAALTALVAMTTSWFGHRDVASALATRLLNRRRARLYHAGYQLMVGGIQAATLAGDLFLTWFSLVVAGVAAAAMTAAARGPEAATAASGLIKDGLAGLLLALLGTLVLGIADTPAGALLLVGYGAVAGFLPLHAWLPAMMAEAPASAAIIITLMANVPLLLFPRLPMMPPLLIAFGLASLLGAALALPASADWRRTVALAHIAQLGIIVFAIGVGDARAAWSLTALLTLARSALLQSQGNDRLAWLAIAVLPLFALVLLATATTTVSPWLLVLLAAVTVLLTWTLLEPREVRAADWRTAAPVWGQLALMIAVAIG